MLDNGDELHDVVSTTVCYHIFVAYVLLLFISKIFFLFYVRIFFYIKLHTQTRKRRRPFVTSHSVT